MGSPASPKRVRFFTSLIYQSGAAVSAVEQRLVSILGAILLKTEVEPFLHTTYYEPEMGTGLLRHFILFRPLRVREDLVNIKLRTNDIEIIASVQGKRTINIDPGYISLEQVVLATTKGYNHRIFLGQGIFGDLTLIYRNGRFEPLPWTYPDYGEPRMLSLLKGWREEYKKELRGDFSSGKVPTMTE